MTVTNIFPTTTPAEVVPDETKYNPKLNNKQQVICQIAPAKFDSLTKILMTLDDENVIIINDSTINQTVNKGVAILTANMTELIGEGINLHILSPKKHLKFFKQMKGNNDIFIIDDPEEERYIVTNRDITLFLSKQINAITEDTSAPDLEGAEVIGNSITLSKDDGNTISSFAREGESTHLLLQDNQLKAISIPDIAVIKFKDYIDSDISDVNCDLKLKSLALLKVNGEEYIVHLGKKDDVYWLVTHVNTGYVNITVLEMVSQVSETDLLI
jgi:hypothetical protein